MKRSILISLILIMHSSFSQASAGTSAPTHIISRAQEKNAKEKAATAAAPSERAQQDEDAINRILNGQRLMHMSHTFHKSASKEDQELINAAFCQKVSQNINFKWSPDHQFFVEIHTTDQSSSKARLEESRDHRPTGNPITIRLLSTKDARVSSDYQAADCEFSPGGKYLVTYFTNDQGEKAASLNSLEKIESPALSMPVNTKKVHFSANDASIAAQTQDSSGKNNLEIFACGKRMMLEGDYYFRGFSPDGKWIALESYKAEEETSLTIICLETGKRYAFANARWRSFSPDSNWCVFLEEEYAEDDRQVFYLVPFSLKTGNRNERQKGSCAAFSPDSKWLALWELLGSTVPVLMNTETGRFKDLPFSKGHEIEFSANSKRLSMIKEGDRPRATISLDDNTVIEEEYSLDREKEGWLTFHTTDRSQTGLRSLDTGEVLGPWDCDKIRMTNDTNYIILTSFKNNIFKLITRTGRVVQEFIIEDNRYHTYFYDKNWLTIRSFCNPHLPMLYHLPSGAIITHDYEKEYSVLPQKIMLTVLDSMLTNGLTSAQRKLLNFLVDQNNFDPLSPLKISGSLDEMCALEEIDKDEFVLGLEQFDPIIRYYLAQTYRFGKDIRDDIAQTINTNNKFRLQQTNAVGLHPEQVQKALWECFTGQELLSDAEIAHRKAQLLKQIEKADKEAKEQSDREVAKAIFQCQEENKALNQEALFKAIKEENEEAIKNNTTLFTINAIDKNIDTPLQYAIRLGLKKSVRVLLGIKEKIDAGDGTHRDVHVALDRDIEGGSALHYAVVKKQFAIGSLIWLEMVKRKLDHMIIKRNKDGKTAYSLQLEAEKTMREDKKKSPEFSELKAILRKSAAGKNRKNIWQQHYYRKFNSLHVNA